MTPFTLGVEEEFLIVDAATGGLRPRAERVVPPASRTLGDQVQPELSLSQVEVQTPVCRSLEQVRAELVRLRKEVQVAAEGAGSQVVALGTHPFTAWLGQGITPKDRYMEMDEAYKLDAWQQLICGCHVHVGIDDPEAVVQVMDRSRPWLPVLLALSVNSPFWQSIDTGYSSYRTQLWQHWPTTGTPGVLETRGAYDRLVEELVTTESIVDATRLYWDVRPSARFPTLEFRVADVCPTVDETVMIAALTRSLARTCHVAADRGEPLPRPRGELLRAARWRAARYGIDEGLIDIPERRSRPAGEVVDTFLGFLRPDLETHGEWDDVSGLVRRTLQQGTGARRQRRVFEERGSLPAVVEWAVEQTTGG